MIRFDYYFTSWLVIWFLLYYFNFIKINPKIALLVAIIVNFLIILAMIYNNAKILNIICAIFIIITTKIIPYYLIKDEESKKNDIYAFIIIFIIYLLYVHIISGNIIDIFNEIYYENIILGKKTPIPLSMLSKIINIYKK